MDTFIGHIQQMVYKHITGQKNQKQNTKQNVQKKHIYWMARLELYVRKYKFVFGFLFTIYTYYMQVG